MTLPTTGKISLGDINVELGRSRASPVSLGGGLVRPLAGVPSGQIKLSNLRGKTNGALTTIHQFVARTTSGEGYVSTGVIPGTNNGSSVSPNSFLGVPLDSVYITSSTWQGTTSYFMYFGTLSNAGYSNIKRVKRIVMGGISVDILANDFLYSTGEDKLLWSCVSKALSVAQYNAIYAGIVNKTTDIIVTYE